MLDVNTNVNVEVSTQLAEAMWKSCADNAVGGLFKPWQIRRVARAQADRLRILAKGKRDAELILKGEMTLQESLTGGVVTRRPLDRREDPTLDLSSLPAVIADHYIDETLRKEGNVAKTLLQAEEELQKDNSPAPENPVDGDWLRRWRDEVGEVSSDDLQGIWARLLAGEVKSPGTHSLRTLDVLRNMSSEDAQLAATLARFSIAGFIWQDPGYNHLANAGLGFEELFYLVEMGILTSTSGTVGMAWHNIDGLNMFRRMLNIGTVGIQLTGASEAQTCEASGFTLTRAGAQLMQFCERVGDRQYLAALGRHFKPQGFTVELCDIKLYADGSADIVTALPL